MSKRDGPRDPRRGRRGGGEPGHSLSGFRERLNDLLDELWLKVGTQHPAVSGHALAGVPVDADMHEQGDVLCLEVELPGCEERDVEVTAGAGELTVRGHKRAVREEAGRAYLLQECACGEFTRAFRLPPGYEPERAKATYRNGLLTITVPRAAGARPAVHRIPIEAR